MEVRGGGSGQGRDNYFLLVVGYGSVLRGGIRSWVRFL